MEKFRMLYKNKFFRGIFSSICFFVAYFLEETFDVIPRSEKKLPLFTFLALLVFIYVASDIIKMLKADSKKEKK
ncbi:hypothetical protein [Flavobacterium coralii]|uniref:hypothetical protein n=1 Tax=Flavobacterium coralii TaxID=2838017 RepID=UPI000C5E4821|nr:hypothetical protein [Flavobacterium sp.]